MTVLSLPFTDASLRVGLPFPGLPAGVRLLVVLAGFAALFVALLVLLYRAELKLIPRRFALALVLLRCGLAAVILLALAADPVLTRTTTEEVPGRLLVAVDRTDSMRVTDPARPLAEKLAAGRLLRITHDLAADDRVEAWAEQAAKTGEVRFSAFDGFDAQDQYRKVLKRLDETPRLTFAEKLISADGFRLVEQLRAKHAVEVVAFGKDVAGLPGDPARLAAALAVGKGGAVAYTDLKLPLGRAAETAGDASGPKLFGVILITDGRHNWGEDPIARGRELADRGVPIFPVLVAPKAAPADVAVVSAKAQAATVFKGSIVPVEANVRVTGWPAGPIVVKLARPDGPDGTKYEPLSQTVAHDGTDATYALTFKLKADDPGPMPLTVTAEPREPDPFPENNRRTARINVVKDRAKVMLIDGEARWEFHYLHTCLGRDPNMDVRSVVFRQPRIGAIKDENELRKMGTPARQFPADEDVLSAYDCVILGDVEPAQMSAAERLRIEKYVAEAGGTLVMVAGKRSMPAEYLADGEPFRKLLPIRNPRPVTAEDGFMVGITPEGERSWFLGMADGPAENRAQWDRFPPHYWGMVGSLKDGAEALALVPGGNPAERALIARQSYGFGRVLYVGLDSTWRWRYKAGDVFHHRFWGQVAQWAASDRLLPVTNAAGTIRFGTREPVIAGGQDVEIVARAAEAVKKLSPNALKGARIFRKPDDPGGKETPVGLVPLTHPEARPRDLIGRAKDLPPGKYVVELEVPEWSEELVGPPGPDGRAGKLRCPFEVMPPDNEELVELSANGPLMEELAKLGGGKVYTLETAGQLIDDLSARNATREILDERPLRRSWWAFGLILSLLAAEWGLRKWAGLP